MEQEGLGALIFGATGAIGTVSFSLLRNLCFSCLDHHVGARCIVWFANKSRNGRQLKADKSL